MPQGEIINKEGKEKGKDNTHEKKEQENLFITTVNFFSFFLETKEKRLGEK